MTPSIAQPVYNKTAIAPAKRPIIGTAVAAAPFPDDDDLADELDFALSLAALALVTRPVTELDPEEEVAVVVVVPVAEAEPDEELEVEDAVPVEFSPELPEMDAVVDEREEEDETRELDEDEDEEAEAVEEADLEEDDAPVKPARVLLALSAMPLTLNC